MTTDLLAATVRSIQGLAAFEIDRMAEAISLTRAEGGRLFVLGNGGGAAHASHAAADFRKLCGIEAYCPSDNAAELTARINDEGWATCYRDWLRESHAQEPDAILVVSVGGGSQEPPVSTNLVLAVDYARDCGARVLAVVGTARTLQGGYAGAASDVAVVIPCDTPEFVTPVVEGCQSVVLHALAVHPKLAVNKAKWEGLA